MNVKAWTTISSPVGELTAESDGAALLALRFHNERRGTGLARDPQPELPLFARLRAELERYFAGEAVTFSVPLAPQGTPFQQKVWKALLAIPYGRTESYSALAQRIGQPSAVRAVGAANGRNPIPILIPCHRVIGADGTLTGYAGGLARKQALLALERAAIGAHRQAALELSR